MLSRLPGTPNRRQESATRTASGQLVGRPSRWQGRRSDTPLGKGRAMGENGQAEGEHQPRAEASAFEPPTLTVVGTVKELTHVKVGPAPDGVDMFVSQSGPI